MRISRAVRSQFSAASLLVATAAIAALALPVAIQSADPPAAEGAMSPSLAAAGPGFLLSWIEPAAGGSAVRYARLEKDKWSEPRTVASGSEVLANWARSPAIARAS